MLRRMRLRSELKLCSLEPPAATITQKRFLFNVRYSIKRAQCVEVFSNSSQSLLIRKSSVRAATRRRLRRELMLCTMWLMNSTVSCVHKKTRTTVFFFLWTSPLHQQSRESPAPLPMPIIRLSSSSRSNRHPHSRRGSQKMIRSTRYRHRHRRRHHHVADVPPTIRTIRRIFPKSHVINFKTPIHFFCVCSHD